MEYRRAARLIAESKAAVALTGAGISAESGIPTFRGPGGLWEKYNWRKLATREAFYQNPKLVWEWYAMRIKMILEAKPNPAHIALARLEEMGFIKAVITQNVDGLHRRAGSRKVIELHGSISRVRCIGCSRTYHVSEIPYEIPPRCSCGALLRPDVVWFGEPLPRDQLEEALRMASQADLIMVVGTSLLVQPAASLPFITIQGGGKAIEVNPEETPLTPYAAVSIRERAAKALPRLLSELEQLVAGGQ